MRFAKYLIVIFFLHSATAYGAVINVATCGRADVAAAVNFASDGDTVVIPAGTCTWTTNVTITNKILTLQGAGIDQTVIVHSIGNSGNIPFPQALLWITKDGGVTRMTGITFRGGTLSDPYNKGMVVFDGTSHQLRIDHCKFVPTTTSGYQLYGFLWGVIDHNTIDLSSLGVPSGPSVGTYVHNGSAWNVPGSDFGDASWADITDFGTQRAIFVEDNVFTNNQSVSRQAYANDGWQGGRVVYRHNTYTNATWANHGTESSGRWRSQRSFEVYSNTFSLAGVDFASLLGSRGGVGVVYNNTATVTGGTVTAFADLQYYRATAASDPWGQCNGSSVWDQNGAPSGGRCLDQAGVGKGDLLSNFNPTPVGWPHQIVEPTYAWNNTINGSVSKMISNVPSVMVENRDFFNSAKPGYTPYTYPHPLTTGTPTPPASPKNLRIVP